MSTRQRLCPQAVFSTGVLMTADRIGLVTNINEISLVSYTVVYTGTPVGTIQVEVSNDYVPSPAGVLVKPVNAGTWFILATPAPVAISAAGNTYFNVPNIAAAWIRLHYLFTSGTGTLTATLAGKVS